MAILRHIKFCFENGNLRLSLSLFNIFEIEIEIWNCHTTLHIWNGHSSSVNIFLTKLLLCVLAAEGGPGRRAITLEPNSKFVRKHLEANNPRLAYMSAQGHFTSDTSPPTNYSHALSWNVSFRFSISRLVPPHMLAKIHPNQGRSSRKYSKSIKEEPFTWIGGGLSLFHHVIRRLRPKQSPPLSYGSLSPGLYKLPSPDQLCVEVRADHRKLRPSRKKSIKTEPSLGSWRGVNFLYLDRILK